MSFDKKLIVGGVEMSYPFILAAGVAKHPAQTLPYFRDDLPLGAIVTGSYTLGARSGNDGDLVHPSDYGELERFGFALNAYGMPNIGIEAAIQEFAKHPDKKFVVSIADFAVGKYLQMIFALSGVDNVVAIEINASCPNTGHLPAAYDLVQLRMLIHVVASNFGKPIWIKLAPYMTKAQLEFFAKRYPKLDFSATLYVARDFVSKVCALLREYREHIKAVVVANTLAKVVFGEAITVRGEDGSIHHRGGLSGPIIREHNLQLIKEMLDYGLSDIDVIGCGGALTGDDALQYFKADVKAVAFTSGPNWAGPRFFNDLLLGSPDLQDYLTNLYEGNFWLVSIKDTLS